MLDISKLVQDSGCINDTKLFIYKYNIPQQGHKVEHGKHFGVR